VVQSIVTSYWVIFLSVLLNSYNFELLLISSRFAGFNFHFITKRKIPVKSEFTEHQWNVVSSTVIVNSQTKPVWWWSLFTSISLGLTESTVLWHMVLKNVLISPRSRSTLGLVSVSTLAVSFNPCQTDTCMHHACKSCHVVVTKRWRCPRVCLHLLLDVSFIWNLSNLIRDPEFFVYGRAYATVLRLSSVSYVSTECILVKRCVLDQKLLLTAYRMSYIRNRLVPKWMTLTIV